VVRDFNHVWSFGARVVRDEEREHHEIFDVEYFTAHGLRRDLDEHVRERGVDGKNEVDVGVRDLFILHASATVFRVVENVEHGFRRDERRRVRWATATATRRNAAGVRFAGRGR